MLGVKLVLERSDVSEALAPHNALMLFIVESMCGTQSKQQLSSRTHHKAIAALERNQLASFVSPCPAYSLVLYDCIKELINTTL